MSLESEEEVVVAPSWLDWASSSSRASPRCLIQIVITGCAVQAAGRCLEFHLSPFDRRPDRHYSNATIINTSLVYIPIVIDVIDARTTHQVTHWERLSVLGGVKVVVVKIRGSHSSPWCQITEITGVLKLDHLMTNWV